MLRSVNEWIAIRRMTRNQVHVLMRILLGEQTGLRNERFCFHPTKNLSVLVLCDWIEAHVVHCKGKSPLLSEDRFEFHSTVAQFKSALQGLLLSRKPGKPKSIWTSTFGKNHIPFRSNFLYCATSPILTEETSRQLTAHPIGTNTRLRPMNIVTKVDIQLYIYRLFVAVKSRGKGFKYKNPSSTDVASYISEQVLWNSSIVLLNNRRRLASYFFEVLVYLMVPWSTYPTVIKGLELSMDEQI